MNIPKCIGAVEALHKKEVKEILSVGLGDGKSRPAVVIDPYMQQGHLETFLWKDDPIVMAGIKEAVLGPCKYLVLFFEE